MRSLLVDESGKSIVNLEWKSGKIMFKGCYFPPKFANSGTLRQAETRIDTLSQQRSTKWGKLYERRETGAGRWVVAMAPSLLAGNIGSYSTDIDYQSHSSQMLSTACGENTV